MISRHNTYLREQYSNISAYLGILFLVMAGIIVIPLLSLCFAPQEIVYAPAFLIPAAVLAGIGMLLRYGFRFQKLRPLDFNESSIVVFFTWLAISIFGAMPYMYISSLSFSHAVFDSVSGWTTTGLSLLDVGKAPLVVLIYRSWTQFVGGAGIAIIMLASLAGTSSQHIYSAEGKGTLLKPNVMASARVVLKLYLCYTVAGIFMYMLAGMSVLDAVVHCFAAISTGGFSNYPDSIGHFNSIAVEGITLVLMILGNLSFLMGYFIFKGKLQGIWRNGEIRVMIVALCLAIPVLFFAVCSQIYNAHSAIRIAVFEAVSALTTTGFSLVSYNAPAWYEGGVFILVILMLIGGGSCSTAGGIKQHRIYMIYKSILWQLKGNLLPNHAIQKNYIWEGDLKSYSNDERIRTTSNFVLLYLMFFVVGVVVISLSRNVADGSLYPIKDALFEFASTLGTVGLSIGITSTNAPLHIIWLQILGMLLGRLEFYVIIMSVVKLGKDAIHSIR